MASPHSGFASPHSGLFIHFLTKRPKKTPKSQIRIQIFFSASPLATSHVPLRGRVPQVGNPCTIVYYFLMAERNTETTYNIINKMPYYLGRISVKIVYGNLKNFDCWQYRPLYFFPWKLRCWKLAIFCNHDSALFHTHFALWSFFIAYFPLSVYYEEFCFTYLVLYGIKATHLNGQAMEITGGLGKGSLLNFWQKSSRSRSGSILYGHNFKFQVSIVQMQNEMSPFGLPHLINVFWLRVLQNYEWCHRYYTVTVRKVKLTFEGIFRHWLHPIVKGHNFC